MFCNLLLHHFKEYESDILVKLYKTYVRPMLKYGSVIFSLHFIYLENILENVRRKFTKRLPSMLNKEYNERLQLCNLTSLSTRRANADLVFMYKILHNIVTINLQDSVVVDNSQRTRGRIYELKIFRPRLTHVINAIKMSSNRHSIASESSSSSLWSLNISTDSECNDNIDESQIDIS